ncbi:TPA: YbjN domain-containing protein, partial [Pseudomonas aeruginosa]|nr:YbjN domain-containing protein [Pseudomonas aeruginosa]
LANLRSHIELWDRLLQEFIAYLRDYSRLAAEQQGMAQDAGQPVDGEA